MHPYEQNTSDHRTHSPATEAATETVHATDLGGPRGGGSTPPFYWQLSKEDRARLDHLIVEDEGYLAHDINWGRQMLDVRLRYKPVPDVSPHWVPPQTPEHFSDAISAILQVAIDAGLDPEAVCDASVDTCHAARRSATASIRRD